MTKQFGNCKIYFSHVLKKDLQKTITWNDAFLQHMRKINLTNAQSLMWYLRKTWTWNNIFLPHMRKVNICKIFFRVLMKNDLSNKYLLQISISCHRLRIYKIFFLMFWSNMTFQTNVFRKYHIINWAFNFYCCPECDFKSRQTLF